MFGFWPNLSDEFYHCFRIKEAWHRFPIKSHNFFLADRERKPARFILTGAGAARPEHSSLLSAASGKHHGIAFINLQTFKA